MINCPGMQGRSNKLPSNSVSVEILYEKACITGIIAVLLDILPDDISTPPHTET